MDNYQKIELMKVFIYNETGNGYFKFEADDYELQDNEMNYNGICEFREPKRNMTTGELEEGASEEVIQFAITEKINDSLEYIKNKYVSLLKSALERATNKTGDLDYLNSQRDEYEEKYKLALRVIDGENCSTHYLFPVLENEKEFEDFVGIKLQERINSYGLTSLNDRLKDYCQVVKFMFEYSNPFYLEMKSMIIYFRTRMVTDVEFGLWNNFNARKDLVSQITPETDIVGMRNLYNQSLSL